MVLADEQGWSGAVKDRRCWAEGTAVKDCTLEICIVIFILPTNTKKVTVR